MANDWQEDELLLTLHLYCRTPFGKLHKTNPDIIQLAKIIGRSPSAVALKVINFASLDPAFNPKGTSNVSKADRMLWNAFMQNPIGIAEKAERLYGSTIKPFLTNFDKNLVYSLPDPKTIESDSRIISDLNIIIENIPKLIKFLSKNPQYLQEIESREFEEVVAEIFRKQGFEVELTKRTRDGGKDIIAVQRHALGIDTKYFIECKRYSLDHKVSVDIVRNLYGVKNTVDGANKIILATTSTFTKDAINFAKEKIPSKWEIDLKDYNDVTNWIYNYK